MATYNKFHSFVEALAEKQHNLGTDTLKVYLSKEELGGMRESLEEHRRIVNAIRAQDGAEAEAAMWDHLARVQERLAGENNSGGG